MELPVGLQLRELLLALCTGAAFGLLYDFLRLLRGSSRLLAAAADLLYSLLLLIGLLVFALYAGRGRLRLFALIFMAMGGTAYLLTLSGPIRAGAKLARRRLLRPLLRPAAAACRGLKKFLEKCKKLVASG